MLLALLSLMIVFPTPAWIFQMATGGAVIVVGVIVILIALGNARDRIASLLRSLLCRLPKQYERRSIALFDDFVGGLTSFRGVANALMYAFTTLMVWSGDVLVCCLVMRAFGISLTIPAVVFVVAAAALSTTVPALPGYVGTYQFVVVNVLNVLGVAVGPATAFALGIHGLTWLTINTVGASIAVGMLKNGRLATRGVGAESS
jgi:uncharacterized protein (TIRG00374 family)